MQRAAILGDFQWSSLVHPKFVKIKNLSNRNFPAKNWPTAFSLSNKSLLSDRLQLKRSILIENFIQKTNYTCFRSLAVKSARR